MKQLIHVIAASLLASAAAAENTVTVKDLSPGAKDHWTAEDFARAVPLPLPRAEFDPAQWNHVPVLEAAADEGFEQTFPSIAEGPTLKGRERFQLRRQLFDFDPVELGLLRRLGNEVGSPRIASKNFGTFGLDYTSSRLIPSSAANFFPYSAVGKIFFSDGANSFECSGAVITRRLVLTAGHCVHGGPAEGFFQDFMFVPAYFRGEAPFGVWEATGVFVSAVWANSGEVPNAEDWALLEMEDQNGLRISEVTGKLAFLADALVDNHLHLLGYPGNLDGGAEMHQVTSGDSGTYSQNTALYGSDMGGGSSGGPWVQNFNRKAQGQGGGRNRARAAVVGVASFGFGDNGPEKVQGASILSRNFKILRQLACRHQEGNC